MTRAQRLLSVSAGATSAAGARGVFFPRVPAAAVNVRPSTVVVRVATGGAVGAATFTYSVHEEGGGSSDDASTGGPLEIRPVVNIGGNLRLLFYLANFVAGETVSFTVATGEEAKLGDSNVPNIFV